MRGGESPKEIGRDLNRQGVPYFWRALWDGTKVRNIAASKPAAGKRIYHGDVVMRKEVDPDAPDGYRMVPVDVSWEPIITQEEHEKVVAILRDPKRATHREGTRAKHRWTGIARCGECGDIIQSRNRHDGPRYNCRKGCVSRSQVRVDAWLTEHAIQLLEREDAATLFRLDQPVGSAAEALAEAEQLRAKLDGFRDDVLAERISRESFAVFEMALLPKIRDADDRAKRAALPPVLAQVIGPDARKVFLGLDIAQQREILRAIMRPKIYHTKSRTRGRLETSTIDPGFLFGLEVPGEAVSSEPTLATVA
nr:hypothetical protein GCM10017745_30970 [Saccharothrix mutabilis subsp. capreolus]